MATGYDESGLGGWGVPVDTGSPLQGLGTTFASAPMDQTDALMKKLEEVSGRKRPRLSETLSTGDKIAAAFGQIGTTMQRMAGRNVPYYMDELRAQKREEFETGQSDELKTLGLKIQMAKMRGDTQRAKTKEYQDFVKEAPGIINGWIKAGVPREKLGELGRQMNKSSLAQFGHEAIPTGILDGIVSSDPVIAFALEGHKKWLPAELVPYIGRMLQDESGRKQAEPFLENLAVTWASKQINTRAQEKGITLPDAALEIVKENPSLAKLTKDIPEYQKPPQMGAEVKLEEENRQKANVLLQAVRAGHMPWEGYVSATANMKGVDSEKALTVQEKALYQSAGQKIGGAIGGQTPIAPGGPTPNELETRQKMAVSGGLSQDVQDFLRSRGVDPAKATAAEIDFSIKQAHALKTGEDEFTPSSIKAMVDYTLATGTPPPMGMAAKGRAKFWDGLEKEIQASGGTMLDVAVTKAAYGAATTALKQNMVRETLIHGFTNKIEENVKTIQMLQRKYGKNQFGVMINSAQNLTIANTRGSGDLESLRLALVSTSNEVAKVESGSLGIAEISVQQAETMKRIHNPNLNAEDLNTVLDTSMQLGRNAIKALTTENERVKSVIRKGAGKGEAPNKQEPPTTSDYPPAQRGDKIPTLTPAMQAKFNAAKNGDTIIVGPKSYVKRGGILAIPE